MSTKMRVRLGGAVALSLTFFLSNVVHAADALKLLGEVSALQANDAAKDLQATARETQRKIEQKRKFQSIRKAAEAYKGSYPTQGEIQRAKSPQDGTVRDCVGPNCKALRTKVAPIN